MSGEEVEFLPRNKLSEYRGLVNNHVILDRGIPATGRRLTPIEKAELLESLGTCEFYEGNWHQAVQCLKPSLTEYLEVAERRSPTQLVSSYILLGIAMFKIGELEGALTTLEDATKLAKEKNLPSLAAKALSNRAAICGRLGRLLESINLSRQAIEASTEVNHAGAFEHLQYARVLIQSYIKIRDYDKAENVVESFSFSKDGGIYFASGSVSKAGEVLFKLLGSQNQTMQSPDKGNRQSIVSAEDLDNAIQHIENDLEQWSVSESKSEHESLVEGSEIEDPEILRKRQEDENQYAVKIERIVERAITLYNSSLFMPTVQPAAGAQRSKSLGTPNKNDPPLNLTAAALQQNLQQGQRLQQLAMDSLKLFVRKLRKRRALAYDDRQYDAFERVPWNMYPDVLSNDLYMYPAVCWAVLLQANAERYLQDSVQFHQGLRIQRGDVVLSTEDYQEQFDMAESFYTKAIKVIEAARFHGGYETIDDDSPGKDRRNKSIAPKASVYGEEDTIKNAAANLAAAFNAASPSASPTKSVAVEAKSRQGSTAVRPSKRGSTDTMTSPNRRTTKAVEVPTVEEKTADSTAFSPEDIDATSVITKMTSMDMHLADTVDTSILKDIFLNVKQLMNMDNDMRTNRGVMSTAHKSLTRQGLTDFNPWTGQLGTTALPSLFPTTNTGVKTDDRPSNAVGQLRDPSGPEKKGVQVTYKPKQDDPLSLRSEMIPTKLIFGLDEASSWIQWALGAVGGISLGFLGHSCMSAEELVGCITADNEPKKSKVDSLNESAQPSGPRLPESFLIEVRNRLMELDTNLTLTDEIDTLAEEEVLTTTITASPQTAADAIPGAIADTVLTGDAAGNSGRKKRRGDHLLSLPSGQLETRLILLFVLVKVTAELHWKKELLPSLLQLEKTYDILRQRYGPSIAYRYELIIYGTMIQKFRLEYDQWLLLSSEVMSEGERAEVLMLQILPRAKKYHASASEMMMILQAVNNNPMDPMARDNGQLYLMKDAVKKLTNVYIGIGNIPIKIQPPSQSSYGGKKKGAEAAPPPAMIIQPPGTMEEYERFSEREVEDKEKNDIKWLQKFGRIRAKVVYQVFKSQFGNTLKTRQSASVGAATNMVTF